MHVEILNHRNSRLDPLDARLNPRKFRESRIESRVSRIKTRVTVNLLFSGAVIILTHKILSHQNHEIKYQQG